MNHLTYLYLLTPLHTGASSQAGNILGIAREAQTNLPYLPASSIRGKLRALMHQQNEDNTGELFGKELVEGQNPTEGQIWFADATLLFFPIASFSHQYLWITCPLWLKRWYRWHNDDKLAALIEKTQQLHAKDALTDISDSNIYLQGAVLQQSNIEPLGLDDTLFANFGFNGQSLLDNPKQQLVIISDENCGALLETGLQQEVRIKLKTGEKVVDGGSFRSEQALPSETILFFPWGTKTKAKDDHYAQLKEQVSNRLQFGGSEGLGRGWTATTTTDLN